jgi:hypothetical protein
VYRKTETKRKIERERVKDDQRNEWVPRRYIVYTLYAAAAVVAAGSASQPLPPLTLFCMRSLRVDSVRVIYGDEYILLLCARCIYTRSPPLS